MQESNRYKLNETGSLSSYRRERNKKSTKSLKSVLVSGVGFLADAYDLFVIDFVVAILSISAERKPTSAEKSMIVATTHAGAVLGQLTFGVAADFIGRKTMFIVTASFIILGSIISSLVGIGYTHHTPGFNIFIQLALCRFFLGFGIGGEYPLSATVTSEAASNHQQLTYEPEPAKGLLWYLTHKPNSIAVVFSMQGLGMLLSPLFVWAFLSLGLSLELTWRVCLAIGAIPSGIAFYFRWHMHESAAFQKAQREYSFAESITTGATNQSDKNPHKHEFIRNSLAVDINKTSAVFSPDNLGNQISKESNETDLPSLLDHKSQIDTKFNTDDKFMSIFTPNNQTRNHKIPNPPKPREEEKSVKLSLYRTFTNKLLRRDQRESLPLNVEIKSASEVNFETAKPTWAGFARHLRYVLDVLKQNKTMLLASSVTWFLIDVTLYGTGSFKSAIIETWFPQGSKNSVADSVDYVILQAKFGVLIALIAIPGYILSIFFIHLTGTRKLQIYGFVAIGVVFIALGLTELLNFRNDIVQLLLFGSTFLASNFGPNTTTFILPTQLYPTLVRATCHGFSAAMGKLGGMLGTGCFPFLLKGAGMGWLLICCGVVAFIGISFSMILPQDNATEEHLRRAENRSLSVVKPIINT